MLLCKILLLAEIVKSNDPETENSYNWELFTYLLFQGHCWFLHGSHILFSMKRELRPPYGLDKTTPFPNNHIINGRSEKGAQNCVLLA